MQAMGFDAFFVLLAALAETPLTAALSNSSGAKGHMISLDILSQGQLVRHGSSPTDGFDDSNASASGFPTGIPSLVAPSQPGLNVGSKIGDLVIPPHAFRRMDSAAVRELMTYNMPTANTVESSTTRAKACPRQMPSERRLFLMQLVFPFQGSTALAGMLMSSPEMATLCAFRQWNCEGRKILEATHLVIHDKEDYATMLDLYAAHWDISKPVLFDKSPGLLLSVPAVSEGLNAAPIPTRMIRRGVTEMKYAYILMWRPLCLAPLSNHARRTITEEGSTALARVELKRLQHHMSTHKYLTDHSQPVLVINMGDLIWRPERNVQRLEEFAPCLGSIDASYVPQLGVDIFEGNGWKADGSIKSFGETVDPAALNYRVGKGSCDGRYSFGEQLSGAELHAANDAMSYLSWFS